MKSGARGEGGSRGGGTPILLWLSAGLVHPSLPLGRVPRQTLTPPQWRLLGCSAFGRDERQPTAEHAPDHWEFRQSQMCTSLSGLESLPMGLMVPRPPKTTICCPDSTALWYMRGQGAWSRLVVGTRPMKCGTGGWTLNARMSFLYSCWPKASGMWHYGHLPCQQGHGPWGEYPCGTRAMHYFYGGFNSEWVGSYPLTKCPLRRANCWVQDLCKIVLGGDRAQKDARRAYPPLPQNRHMPPNSVPNTGEERVARLWK